MPRKPRQFEFDKPIEVLTRYTRSVSVPPSQLWQIKQLFNALRKKYKVKVINTHFDENHVRMHLFFKKGCGCKISQVMQWFLTRLAKCVNGILKSHGKVFYDRYISKILNSFHGLISLLKMFNEEKNTIHEDGKEITLVSVPWSIPDPRPNGMSYCRT